MNLRDEVKMRQAAGESFPVPPFPPHDSRALAFTDDSTYRQALEDGDEMNLLAIITHAVVTGWYAGYLHAVDGPAADSLFDAPTG